MWLLAQSVFNAIVRSEANPDSVLHLTVYREKETKLWPYFLLGAGLAYLSLKAAK